MLRGEPCLLWQLIDQHRVELDSVVEASRQGYR